MAASRANEEIVICVTGNGLKTQDAVFDALDEPATIKPALADFEALAGSGTWRSRHWCESRIQN